MTNVTISPDSENDPNLQFIKDFNLAFATCDTDYILGCFAQDAHWEMVGGQSWDGKTAIAEALKGMSDGEASELIMDAIVSHANKSAANGVLKYSDGRSVAYCDVYTFTDDTQDPKIKSLTAYAIEMTSQ